MTSTLERLLAIMARLRDPALGCPWDREQNFATIAPYTIEEAYEVADAIERGNMAALKDELGDLLFQIVFHARLAEEAGLFDFADIAAAIAEKMVRRHPHVFGSAAIASAAAQSVAWEQHKANEREAQATAAGTRVSVLDGVALALPALLRAAKISRRAARIGFDWPDARSVLPKITEEIAELDAELSADAADQARIEDELGDILFAVANLARKFEIDPEAALRRATAKFERRFRQVEKLAAERGTGLDLDRLEALWQEVKQEERRNAGFPRPSSVRADREEPAERESEGQTTIRLEPVTEILPNGFDALWHEARREGYRMLDRLAAEWHAGTTVFNRAGEGLLAAYRGRELAGIGGITQDPAVPGALRMRRFYVRRSFRRRGIARRLALALLDQSRWIEREIIVNAGAGSEPFWEALGFIPDRRDGHTHILLPAAIASRSPRL